MSDELKRFEVRVGMDLEGDAPEWWFVIEKGGEKVSELDGAEAVKRMMTMGKMLEEMGDDDDGSEFRVDDELY